MDFLELMTGELMAGMSVSALKTPKLQFRQHTGRTVEFGRILENSMYRKNRRSDADPTRRGVSSEKTAGKRMYDTFRSVANKTRRPAGSDDCARKRPVDEYQGDSPDTVKDKRSDPTDMLEVLAQLTGVEKSVLQELLTAHGISAHSTDAHEDLIGIVNGLTELFGLDSEQQAALTELMQIMGESADMQQQAHSIAGQDNSIINAMLTQDTTGVTHEVQKDPASLSGIYDKIREAILHKLDEYAEKSGVDRETAEAEIRSEVLGALEKAKLIKNVTFEANEAEGPETGMLSEDSMSGISDMTRDVQEDMESAEERGGKDFDFSQKPALQQDNIAVIDEDIQNHGFIAVMQDTQSPDAVSHIMTDRTAGFTATAREIISQITDKAAVTLTQEKSEIVMELKPETLGRLSLKVVTENGIVMAKFEAENSQVQRLLESNMQMLRDSLERQGIIVQDLSVSVRQDEAQTRENELQYRNMQGVRRAGTTALEAARILDASGIPGDPEGGNSYLWQGSTINLTA